MHPRFSHHRFDAKRPLRGSSLRSPRLGLIVLGSCAVACGATQLSAPAARPPLGPAPVASAGTTRSMTPDDVARSFGSLGVATAGHNLIRNASFDGPSSLPWMPLFTKPAEGEAFVRSGAYCLAVTNPGKHPWDVQFRHREISIERGHKYAVRFKVGSTVPTSLTAKVAMSGAPYTAYWQMAVELDGPSKVVDSEFTMASADDPTAEFAFHIGGAQAAKTGPFAVCVDDVALDDPQFDPKRTAVARLPVPDVLVNQLGYLPDLPKTAIVRTDDVAPLSFELVDAAGRVVASGTTVVHGFDAASGDRVQMADFSSFRGTGRGFTLRAGRAISHPFDITADLYRKLKYDALAYFYQTRSGIPIEMPYAGDAKWARPAGHLSDSSVHCAPDAGCDYSLDVRGGWYDAGDQGKYVVNAGISVWTLLDQYERAKYLGGNAADFGDGKLGIPENHNGVPDLLDEVRWELEFLMRMQVPEGSALAGMAHHKIHDQAWTALGTSPDRDPLPRYLRPPSTAATLNLAAVAGQCARVWRTIDAPFADRCLRSAERAFRAALAHPAMYITSRDSEGGGAYEDDDVTDEFYWAAAELLITTGRGEYHDVVAASRHRGALPTELDGGEWTSQTWQRTASLGTMSLAIVPGSLPAAERTAARRAIVHAADVYLDIDRAAGYRVPLRPAKDGLHWGSNALPLNNAIVMGVAYDLTRDRRYLEGVQDAASYILGRNPLDQSYVTGYGLRPLENPHHRFWAHQANPAFPTAPPGILSGGPNSLLQDPYVKAAGLAGCAPMKCFADNIEAFSVNEEAINWNAALAWVTAFLDDHGEKRR